MTRFAVIALLLVAWEIGGRYANRLFFRPLSEVIEAGAELLRDPNTQHAIVTTFWELALSFVLSVVVGIIIGMIVAANRLTYQSTYPVILLIYAIPQITVLPLFVLYFGPGPRIESRVRLQPRRVSDHSQCRRRRPERRQAAAGERPLDGRHALEGLSKDYLPASGALPVHRHAARDDRVPAGRYSRANYTYRPGGIGFLTRQYTETFRPDRLFALVGVLALLAIVLNESLRRAELHFGRWR